MTGSSKTVKKEDTRYLFLLLLIEFGLSEVVSLFSCSRNSPLQLYSKREHSNLYFGKRLSFCESKKKSIISLDFKAAVKKTSLKVRTMDRANPRILALFDVDGTLTAARKEITPEMDDFMKELKKHVVVGVVGGSDLAKQQEQIGENVTKEYDYSFSENGLVAFKNGELIGKTMINDHLGEENIKAIVNWVMKYLSEVDIPVKRGTFIEYRTGMLNISPVGRNCSRDERNAFEEYDKIHNIRPTMVAAMKKEFEHLNLTYSIGGQISFDVFPQGWDKTYCLNFIPEGEYDEIHFFGDKTFEGGNDYEIFTCPRVKGHTVTSPDDTKQQCTELFFP